MNIVFIPCRLKSSRMPQKALRLINGVSVIERCLYNARSIRGVDKIIIATSNNEEDRALEQFANSDAKIDVVFGSEDDVLQRIMPIVDAHTSANFIRITGDCPAVSGELIEKLLHEHETSDADMTFAESGIALGISGEVYTGGALQHLKQLVPNTNFSEYLIYYFLNNPHLFQTQRVVVAKEYHEKFRLTVDEEADILFFDRMYCTLSIGARPVLYSEIFSFLKNHPEVVSINSNVGVKYRDDEELIRRIKQATTILL